MRPILRRYFLDENGNSDRAKTPYLILLPGYTDRYLALTGKTGEYPLYTWLMED